MNEIQQYLRFKEVPRRVRKSVADISLPQSTRIPRLLASADLRACAAHSASVRFGRSVHRTARAARPRTLHDLSRCVRGELAILLRLRRQLAALTPTPVRSQVSKDEDAPGALKRQTSSGQFCSVRVAEGGGEKKVMGTLGYNGESWREARHSVAVALSEVLFC
eukprot:3778644-Prymnesium_polylepis.3